MDVALAIFNIGAGLGVLAAGLSLAYLAWRTTPLIRESRELAADVRRLTRTVESEVGPLLGHARELASNAEVLSEDVAVKLDHVSDLVDSLQVRAASSTGAGPGFEEAPRLGDGRNVEETSFVAPRFDETPRFDEGPRLDEAPRFDETPRFDEGPRLDDASRFDEGPRFNEQPPFEESPLYGAPRFEDAPRLDEVVGEERPREEAASEFEEAAASEEAAWGEGTAGDESPGSNGDGPRDPEMARRDDAWPVESWETREESSGT
jgi:hypothetical protein